MFTEFSLSLKNIKKLVGQEDKMGNQSQITNGGLHVSDYTDKEKSRNYIQNANVQSSLDINKNSKQQNALSSQTSSKMTTNQSTQNLQNNNQQRTEYYDGAANNIFTNQYQNNEKNSNSIGNNNSSVITNNSPTKMDSLHTVLVKQQQWSASKEKQVKELAQDQIRRGLIIPNTIQSGQYDVQQYKSRGNSLTHRSAGHSASVKKTIIDSNQKSELRQKINDMAGGNYLAETERYSETKRNLMKSFSQKSIENFKFPGQKIEKQDSTQKILLEMHKEDKQRQYEQAYKSSKNAMQDTKFSTGDSKTKVAFRIRSGNRTGSHRRALQAHSKLEEEKAASQVAKHLRKTPAPDVAQNQIKRIQSAYNQRQLCQQPLFLSQDGTNLKTTDSDTDDPKYEIQRIAQLGKQQSESHSHQFQSFNLQQTTNKLFTIAGMQNSQRSQQFNIRSINQTGKIGIQHAKSGSVLSTLPIKPLQRKSSIKQPERVQTPAAAYSNTARIEFPPGTGPNQILVEGVKQKLLACLYEAKCKDLQLKAYKEQEKRFFEFCQKTISNRKIIMRECGLGEASATVLSQIITGDYFSHLDLGKNNLGNAGLVALLKGIKQNCSLIHLDLGSNDITFEGAAKLFKSLETHLTLSSLTLANHDRLHRNRMGFKACEALNELLKKNKILSMINISDNAISNEGLKIISNGAFTLESNLVGINMSNNDLQGSQAIQCFSEIISLSKSLLELNLSDNLIGDQGIDEFTKLFTQNASRLMRLHLGNINASAQSVGRMFFALKSNNFMTHLSLDSNDMSHQCFDQISLLLWNNRKLQSLEFKSCNISNYGCEAIIEGMSKNTTLKYLDLTSNKFNSNAMRKWLDILGRTGLLHLDLSNNNIDDDGVQYIVKGLGVHQENKKCPTMTFLGLKNVNMKDAGGSALSQMMSSNTQIVKLITDSNTVSHKYIEEIQAACLRNKQIQKQNTVPKFKDELGHLIQITQEQTKKNQIDSTLELPMKLQEKRMNCIRKIKTLHVEKGERVKEIFEGEDIIQDLQDQEEEMYREFRLIKEQNERVLGNLDERITKFQKKELNKELWIQEQLDNIDKRMDYVKLKNRRVQVQIDHEQTKINKEQDKYKDYVFELQQQLEEAEKEARMAQVLHKTYVDQLEREKNKMIEEARKNNSHLSEDNKDILLHHHNTYDNQSLEEIKELIIRNNEGKICKRKGSKSTNRKKKSSKALKTLGDKSKKKVKDDNDAYRGPQNDAFSSANSTKRNKKPPIK